MIVTQSNFYACLGQLAAATELSLDTETTGLRPYHGSRLFSVIITPNGGEAFYFNFKAYVGLDPDAVLDAHHLEQLRPLLEDDRKFWRFVNAKYDMAILAAEGLKVTGDIHCCVAIGRVEWNDHRNYDMESMAERLGLRKDNAVEAYIDAHPDTCKESRRGATDQYTHKFFDRVPYEIIVPYGCQDGIVTNQIANAQIASIRRTAHETPAPLPNLLAVFENEKRLTHTTARMEQLGVRIDRPYCVRAASYESDRAEKSVAAFKGETGRDFSASNKLFAEVFGSERDLWVWGKPTKTGQVNPSFDSDVLKRFKNPAAAHILAYRDAKSRSDFYKGFLYHADARGDVHPNYNQPGAAHGRFSSSNPNFQNLTSEEDAADLAAEFVVRRAIIPRPGFVFIMPDYDQMEYRLMFDLACDLEPFVGASRIVLEILAGKDPHQATADIVTRMGTVLSRSRAKNGNFAFLYGSGDATLAATIGSSISEARKLKVSMASAAPEVANYVNTITDVARGRGFIYNWFGRRCQFPNARVAYRAANYHVSGGCADVFKVAMNRVDQLLLTKKSRIVMTVHDELPCEIHESELATVPRLVKEIMEGVYPHKYLPLTAGMEWSDKSLADKRKGFPV